MHLTSHVVSQIRNDVDDNPKIFSASILITTQLQKSAVACDNEYALNVLNRQPSSAGASKLPFIFLRPAMAFYLRLSLDPPPPLPAPCFYEQKEIARGMYEPVQYLRWLGGKWMKVSDVVQLRMTRITTKGQEYIIQFLLSVCYIKSRHKEALGVPSKLQFCCQDTFIVTTSYL